MNHVFQTRRRGVSLVELAYVLIVIGVVLGIVWAKTGNVYQSVAIASATKQLQALSATVRSSHANARLGVNEDIDTSALSPSFIGHVQDKKVIFNPWHGNTIVFPGNAMGWGTDNYDAEFTIRMDSVPSDACTQLIMQNTSIQMRALGLSAVMVAPTDGIGKQICFATDYFCKTVVTEVKEADIVPLCKQGKVVSVFFTYGLN